jgi:hypothetical protein
MRRTGDDSKAAPTMAKNNLWKKRKNKNKAEDTAGSIRGEVLHGHFG